MKLQPSEIAWAPENDPEHLIVLTAEESPPKNREQYLRKEVQLLERLVREAGPGELEDANQRLRLNLPEEEQTWLPPDGLADPRGPAALLQNPASLGSRLAEWKQAIAEAVGAKPMPPEEANELAEQLSLEAFLSPLL